MIPWQAVGFLVLQWDHFGAGIKADAVFLLTITVVLASRAVVPKFGGAGLQIGSPIWRWMCQPGSGVVSKSASETQAQRLPPK